MKKWIILLAVVGAIAGGWYYLREYYRFTPIWYQPKFGVVSRGDIRVPIAAAGLIEPNLRIEVKSKASGEVTEVLVREGDFVRKGQVLVRLKQTDEQRRYDAAKAEVERTTSLLAQAEVSVAEARANILSAAADSERLTAEISVSRYELEKIEGWKAHRPELYNEQQYVNAKAQHEVHVAMKKAAEARLEAAHATLQRMEENVKLQKAALTVALAQLGDAEERLQETTIVSRYDAIVTDVRVKVSEVIQSGMATLTGGTVLMYLGDVSRKKVVARVDESDYGRVLKISPISALPEMPGLRDAEQQEAAGAAERMGEVRLTLDAFPENTFTGRIERVEPQGRLNQGAAIIQYNVHVEITDPQANRLPLGAQAQVEFTVESAHGVLRVPSDAVKTHQGQRGVYVEIPPERGSGEQWGRKFVPCRLGITDGEYTQVLEVLGGAELKENMRVYTKLPVIPEERDSERER